VGLCDVAVVFLEGVGLVWVPVVPPVAAALAVLGCVGCVAEPLCEEGDAEVVVGVLDAPADGAARWAGAIPVLVIPGDVADIVPAYEVTAPFEAPVGGFDCGCQSGNEEG
jgi:fermentation-respiration switch protein FrsA (DUF1100 family)